MKTITRLLLAVTLAVGLFITPAPLVSAADGGTSDAGNQQAADCTTGGSSSSDQAKQGLNIVGGLNDTPTNSGTPASQCDGSQVKKIASTAVSILSYVIGLAAIIMLLVSAYKYISSGGDSNKVTSAKKTLIYVVVGLLVAALSQFIVNTVLSTSSSATSGVCKSDSSKVASDPTCK